MEGKPFWVWAAGAVLVLLVAFKVIPTAIGLGATGQDMSSGLSAASALVAQRGAIPISIANSSGKQEWMHAAVRRFNEASPRDATLQVEGKPIFVDVVQETVDGKKVDYRSGTMVADTISEKIKPTVLSPADETWILALRKEWQGTRGRPIAPDVGPALARTPLVIATWQSRAQALGCWPTAQPECTWERVRSLAASSDGWGMLGRPEWGRFKLGYGYVGESNSGTFTAILMCMFGAGKSTGLAIEDVHVGSSCGDAMAALEQAKVHSGNRSEWLLQQMSTGGPEYLDAIVTNEAEVISWNQEHRQNLREPLVSVYPQDGTMVVAHPFTILEGVPWVTPEQVAAAQVFQKFLLTEEQQRALVATGLRPADPKVSLGAPIEPANGADPQARLVILEPPEIPVVDQIVATWHRVKKHAVIALVFDKSGSMAGGKITAAVKGAQEFVRRMDRDDRIIWLPFDNTVYGSVEGYGADVGEELVQRIGSTSASGGTSLYDAVLRAHEQLESQRRPDPFGKRYGIVVLSDGQDTNSRNTLATLEARLRPSEADPTGIQIHTIAIGKDADENVLKKIANAAHGRFWRGDTTEQMVTVYRSIATYY